MTIKTPSLLTLLFTSMLAACAMDGADGADDQADESTDTADLTASNPAPFDLHCLWAGESYASRAPNQYAAQAIRNACDIQASLIPYHAPGMYPLQNRPPTAAEGIDCSGLTSNVWYRATSTWTRLPHSAAAQEASLRHIGWDELLPGDLLFYVSSAALSGRHVTMYLGDGLMIEAASSSRGVIVSPLRYNVSSIGRIW